MKRSINSQGGPSEKKKVTFNMIPEVFFSPKRSEKRVEDRTMVSPAAKPVRLEYASQKRPAEAELGFKNKLQKTSSQPKISGGSIVEVGEEGEVAPHSTINSAAQSALDESLFDLQVMAQAMTVSAKSDAMRIAPPP